MSTVQGLLSIIKLCQKSIHIFTYEKSIETVSKSDLLINSSQTRHGKSNNRPENKDSILKIHPENQAANDILVQL